MMKIKNIAVIGAVLVASLLTLTACTDKNKENNSKIESKTEIKENNSKGESKTETKAENKSSGVDLKYDFPHMNKKIYYVHINTSKDDKVTEFSEDEPTTVKIENEKENYCIDITLDTEFKDGYDQLKTTAKENTEYEETKFGKYEGYAGYYSNYDGIYGNILFDTSDPKFNVFVNFSVCLLDKNSDKNDIKAIYKSSNIQDMLNNIEFKITK